MFCVYLTKGMDDVNYDCWNSNPSIREFMSLQGMHNTAMLEEYYAKRIIGIVKQLGRSQIVWQDPLDNGIKVRILSLFYYFT